MDLPNTDMPIYNEKGGKTGKLLSSHLLKIEICYAISHKFIERIVEDKTGSLYAQDIYSKKHFNILI